MKRIMTTGFAILFFALALAPASAVAYGGFYDGEYISWEIEEYSSGVWQKVYASHRDSASEPHPELEDFYYDSRGYGHKSAYVDSVDFYSSSWRVRPRVGRRYRIIIENETACRIAVTVGVDGKNTVDSSDVLGAAADSSWVIGGRDDITIEGFQSGRDSAMEFYWTVPENAHSDSIYELGAIEMMVYLEDSGCTRREIFGSGGGHDYLRGRRSARSAPDTATGAGDEVDSPVHSVSFLELTDRPVEIVRVSYSAGVSTDAPTLYDNSYDDYYGHHHRNCFTGIGVYVEDTPYSGAPVTRVIQDSPAWRGGLRSGDKIVRANRENVNSHYDLKQAISGLGDGDYMTIKYIRDGYYSYTTVRLDRICP